MIKTVLELDLVGYGIIAEALEAGLDVEISSKLNQQIQSFIDVGLGGVGLSRQLTVMKTTGDGAILVFDEPARAYVFATLVQQATRRHNAIKPPGIGKRVFRIGIATGDLVVQQHAGGGFDASGMAITRAVRLEARAQPGEVICDKDTFSRLTPDQQKQFALAEVIVGKAEESFEGYRCALNPDGVKDAAFFARASGGRAAEIGSSAPPAPAAAAPVASTATAAPRSPGGPHGTSSSTAEPSRGIGPTISADMRRGSPAGSTGTAGVERAISGIDGVTIVTSSGNAAGKVPPPPRAAASDNTVYVPEARPAVGDLAAVATLAVETTRAMAAFNARHAAVPELPAADARQAFLQRLAAEPWNLGFYQAVRRLENLSPTKPRIGHARRLSDEPIRFCQSPSLAFAPATMSGFKQATDHSPARLFVEFLGLCGPSGPMPLHITEYLRDRERNSADPTPARFFDVFNHRMIAMFYRSWAINQQTVSYERSLADAHLPDGGLADRFAAYVASITGVGMNALRNRDAFPDRAKLFYAGRLSNQGKNPEGLAAMVGDYLGVQADITEFVGRWIDVPEDSRCKLGASPETGGLGTTAIIGSKIWDCQQEFQIRLGPMDFQQYQRLLPGGRTLRRLVSVVRNYVGDEFSWTVRLILRADAVPRAKLGMVGQLGFSTWMSSRPITQDQGNLELRPTAA